MLKLSNDLDFVAKLEDIIGLYLDPPEHALVLRCDEKTQIQVLDRTQPGLPLKRELSTPMTHDYKRHGVTTLFAALNTLTGQVLSTADQLHRHQDWLRFLKMLNRNTPKHKDPHLIVDNYAMHKFPEAKAWLAKQPCFHVHFTPASSFWLNMVERFFRDITDNRIRLCIFSSVADLETAISEYIAVHNENPKPLIWSAKANGASENELPYAGGGSHRHLRKGIEANFQGINDNLGKTMTPFACATRALLHISSVGVNFRNESVIRMKAAFDRNGLP